MCLLFHCGTYCDLDYYAYGDSLYRDVDLLVLKSMVIYTVLRFIYVSICSMDFTLRIFSKGVSMFKKRNFLKTFLLSTHTLLVLRPLQDLVAVIVSMSRISGQFCHTLENVERLILVVGPFFFLRERKLL